MDNEHLVNPPSTPARYSFFGSYGHSVDSKGRVIIPNAYRDALGSTFTVGPTRDFEGIALYPDPVFDGMIHEITAMNQRKPIVQKYAAQFFKLSYRDMQPDAQGRVLLPAKLRQRMLGEAKDLEISGGFDYVRIVDAAKADQEDSYFNDNLDDILEQLGNLDE